MNRLYTKEEEKYIVDNYANMPNKEIAEKFGVTECQLRNKAYMMGIKKTKEVLKKIASDGWSKERKEKTSNDYKQRLRKHINVEQAKEIYNSGKGLCETAKMCGTCQATLKKILVEDGIKIRKADKTGEKNYFYKRVLSPEIIEKRLKVRRERYGDAYYTSTEYTSKRKSETMIAVNRKLGKHIGSTYIENKVKLFLERIGMKENVDFVYNKILDTQPGFVFPDFRIESKKICIEADGEYWHSDPIKEELRDNRLRKIGYDVIHLTGKEIVNGDFECKLLKVLNC